MHTQAKAQVQVQILSYKISILVCRQWKWSFCMLPYQTQSSDGNNVVFVLVSGDILDVLMMENSKRWMDKRKGKKRWT